MSDQKETDLKEILRMPQKDEFQGDVPLSEEERQIVSGKREMEEQGYKVYPGIPWRRYFARCFDMQLAAPPSENSHWVSVS